MTELDHESARTQRLRLADGVTRSTAADSRILLRSSTGHFVAVPTGAAPIIAKLEEGCSFGGLRDLLCGGTGVSEERRAAESVLSQFLDNLRKSGFIDGEPASHSRTDRFLARAGADFFARLPLPIDIDRIAEAAALPVRRIPTGLLLSVASGAALIGIAAGLTTVLSHGNELARPPASAIIAVVAMVFVQLALHETFHAIAMRTQHAQVREIGVGLLYYFVPVAYVDRTEAYAVRSRSGLVLIALAGPILDSVLMGVGAVLALAVGDEAHQVLVLYLTAELFLLVANCNPLFRSDGYQAIEAAFGAVNLRARGFTILTNTLLRRQQPAHVRAMTRGRRSGLVLYTAGSVVYLVVMLASLSRTVLVTVLGSPT